MFFSNRKSFMSHHETHDVLDDAPDKPPTFFVTVVVVLSFIFIFSVWFIVESLLWKETNSIHDKEKMGMGNKERVEYVNSQLNYLSSAKKLENNFYKIPIDQAMKKIVESEGSVK